MEIKILGDSWSSAEERLHINELESLALFNVLHSLPSDIRRRPVHIVVDNTTVKGVARKGACLKSAILNDAVVRSLEMLRDRECLFSIKWVKSADNPADLPSRIPLSDISGERMHELQLAVGRFLTGGVAGG